jgi:hypothetical protein
MTAPMDVLAVMDTLVAHRERCLPCSGYDLAGKITIDEANPHVIGLRQRHAEAVAARAAVAELIDTAAGGLNDLHAMIDAADRGEVWVVNAGTRLRLDALRASIARVQP